MEQQIKKFGTLTELLEDLEKEGITGYEKREAVERFFRDRARITRTPFNGSFELTPLCNLDCKMCYVHLNKKQMNQELLPVEQWLDIARQAVEAGMMQVDLTGGECLTYPGFKEIYLYLRSQGIKVSIMTNGALMTEEMVNFFAHHKPESVQISVYGSNREAYRRVTGCDAFDAVMAGIDRLKKASIEMRLSITPNRYMQEDAFELLNLLRSLKVDYGIGGVTLHARPETGRMIDEYEPDYDIYINLRKNDLKYRFGEDYEIKEIKNDRYRFKVRGMEKEGIPCAAGMCSFQVNWRGELMPCPSFHSIAVPIKENGFRAAWTKANEMMMTYQEPSECSNCADKERCVACDAEKTKGIFNGPLDKRVCEKMRACIAADIM